VLRIPNHDNVVKNCFFNDDIANQMLNKQESSFGIGKYICKFQYRLIKLLAKSHIDTSLILRKYFSTHAYLRLVINYRPGLHLFRVGLKQKLIIVSTHTFLLSSTSAVFAIKTVL